MHTEQDFQEPSRTESVGFKAAVIGFLILILMIPTAMVSELVWERKNRRNDVIDDISSKWGEGQIVTGPILSIPYRHYFKDEKEQLKTSIRFLHFMPDTLSFSGELFPEKRNRSLYETVVYRSSMQIQGSFKYPDLTGMGIDLNHVLFEDAFITLGISDNKGIRESLDLVVNQVKMKMEPGLVSADVVSSGVHVRYPLKNSGEEALNFQTSLELNGSEYIQFVPMGRETWVQLSSSWSSPSFNGEFLPIKREVSETGFTADWKVLNLNRNFPQRWEGSSYNVRMAAFGVRLFIEADVYQQTTRSVKYAFMFILFTFATFFFSEIMTKKRVHPIQYIFIGLAMIIFYTLLLSMSEYIPFERAYWVATACVVAKIGLYTKSILRSDRMAFCVAVILTILYSYLFVLLQLEDKALLLGSFGLFVVLGTAMYITRDIDWYGTGSASEDKS